MGFLSLLPKRSPSLLHLRSGSFTVDRQGKILTKTLPSTFPEQLVAELAELVLTSFREAAEAQLPLSRLIVEYPSMKITARELRGGAMIILSARTPYAQSTHA